MLEIFRLIISQKLLKPFIGLILLSTITIILMIVTSHMISALLVDVKPYNYEDSKLYAAIFLLVYVASIFSNLLTPVKDFQIFSNRFKSFQTISNLSKPFQILSNLLKF